jgi:hypothetical protein
MHVHACCIVSMPVCFHLSKPLQVLGFALQTTWHLDARLLFQRTKHIQHRCHCTWLAARQKQFAKLCQGLPPLETRVVPHNGWGVLRALLQADDRLLSQDVTSLQALLEHLQGFCEAHGLSPTSPSPSLPVETLINQPRSQGGAQHDSWPGPTRRRAARFVYSRRALKPGVPRPLSF